MNLQPLFIVPVGAAMYKELALEANKLFEDADKFTSTAAGVRTTLKEYHNGYADTIPPKYPDIANKIKEMALINGREFLIANGYAADKYDLEVSSLWINEMSSGASHVQHNHHGAVLSGCFYVEVPENSSGITFVSFLHRFDKPLLDIETYTASNANTWELRPETGTVLIWESYLTHSVPAAEYEGNRRCVIFDIITRPKKCNTNGE